MRSISDDATVIGLRCGTSRIVSRSRRCNTRYPAAATTTEKSDDSWSSSALTWLPDADQPLDVEAVEPSVGHPSKDAAEPSSVRHRHGDTKALPSHASVVWPLPTAVRRPQVTSAVGPGSAAKHTSFAGAGCLPCGTVSGVFSIVSAPAVLDPLPYISVNIKQAEPVRGMGADGLGNIWTSVQTTARTYRSTFGRIFSPPEAPGAASSSDVLPLGFG